LLWPFVFFHIFVTRTYFYDQHYRRLMKALTIVIFSLLPVLLNSFFAQSKFVQFTIIGLENEQQCRLIEDSIRVHVGIESVRAESYAGNFTAIMNSETSYSKTEFRSWILSLGFDLYCFRTGVLGVDQMTRLKSKECDLLELKQQE